MNLIYKIGTLLCCLPLFLFGQEKDYSVASIPKDLLQNADAIVRLYKKDVLIKNEKNMVVTYTKVITVFNSDGDDFINLYAGYDEGSKISKIFAKEYNANGFEIRTHKKKQFKDRSAVSGFYSDDRVKFLNYTPRSYPYTIEFYCEYKTKTTAFIPSWYPIPGYRISVEKSEFVINNPENILLLKKERNIEGSKIQNKSSEGVVHYLLENQKAIKSERYMPYYNEVLPSVTVGLSEFTLKGYTASNIRDWSDFGKWIRTNLYESQVALDEITKNKVKKLVAHETDPLKKAKLIYEYMQSKTRYVYVGIGVGGWQPTSAIEVDRLGYGDCKGLTNYTKALLDVVGIASNWVLVYSGSYKKDLDKEFTRIQGDHMILNIPKINNGKDVWLECTSQTIPFGYLGSFTDDRDVLVLEKEGGVIKHTPKYPDLDNLQTSNIAIVLDSLGGIHADLSIMSKGIQYNDKYYLESETERDVKEYYKSSRWSYNNNLSIKNYELLNMKDSLEFTENLKVDIPKYATLMGNEILLRTNAFNVFKRSLKRYEKREQPFYIHTGFVDVDTTYFKIPNQFTPDEILPSSNIKNKFGSYHVTMSKVDDETLKYTRSFCLREGKYSKDEYSAYYNFIETVKKLDNLKIVLKRKNNLRENIKI